MDNLKRLEGKVIKSVSEDFDGENSYFIIKFEDKGKVNIVSFVRGDEGTAQLDIDLNGLKEEDLIGKKIIKVEEEFDGEYDYLYLYLRGGKKITISPFSSSPESTAGLDISLYSGSNIVAESLDENTYQQWGQYQMSKPQYEDFDPQKTIVVAIDPKKKRSFPKVIKDLKQIYNEVTLDLELTGEVQMPVIVVADEDATIEDVSNHLKEYIERGTVYTVDEI